MKFEDLEKINNDIRPNSETFKWLPDYNSHDIESDQKILQIRENDPDYSKDDRSSAVIMEVTFINTIDRDDWFCEWDRFGDDENFEALSTIPTSKEDDNFNHIDLIGAISNSDTNHECIPFAIDLTYNANLNDPKSQEKLWQKFNWRHVYGKKANAENVSEFGKIIVEQKYDGTKRLATKPLPMKDRFGMKIPGFVAAKYYRDAGSSYPKASEGCRIKVMPRFIVAFDPDLAHEIAGGGPDRDYAKKYGEAAYKNKKNEYEKAKSRAKWCMLTELTAQAADIQSYLEKLSDDDKKWIAPDELMTATKQITIMKKYFDGALKANNEKALGDQIEQDGKTYASRDAFRQTVVNFSDLTYNK